MNLKEIKLENLKGMKTIIGTFLIGVLGAGIGGYFFVLSDILQKGITSNNLLNSVFIAIITIIFGVTICLVYKNDKVNIADLDIMENELDKIKDIYEDFDVFNGNIELLRNDSKLKKIWKNYKETFLEFKNEDNQFKRHQTVDADFFFNEETLIKEEMRYKVLVYLPQLFLGIGIFGTFLGLAIGLKGINLTATESDAIKKGITGLLEGVTISFYTSVFGIYFSLLTSLLLNFYFEYYEKKVLRIKNLINSKFMRNQNERILLGIKEELGEIKISSNELATKMANALGNKFDLLTKIMNDGMNRFTDNVGTNFQTTLSENLNKVFSEDLVKEFQNVANGLVETVEKNREYTANLEQVMTVGLTNTVKNMNDLIEKTESVVSTTREFANEIKEGFEEANLNLKGTATVMEQIYNDVKALNFEVLDLSKETKEIFQNKESFNNIGNIFDKVDGITKIFLEKIKSEEEISKIWKSFDEEFKNTNNLLVSSFNDYRKEIKESTEEFKKFINHIALNSKDFVEENTDRYQEAVGRGIVGLFKEYDINLSQAVEKFNGVLMNLNEKMDNLETMTKEENEAYENHLTTMIELNKNLKESIKNYKKI